MEEQSRRVAGDNSSSSSVGGVGGGSSADDTPGDTTRRPLQLAFVNFSSGHGRASPNMRQLIRSTATAHSHRDPARKPKARKKTRSKSLRDHEAASMEQLERNLTRVFSSSRTSDTNNGNNNKEKSTEIVETFLQASERDQLARIIDEWDLTRDRLTHASANASPADSTGTADDGKEAYPVPAQPYFADVLHYYRTEYQTFGMYNLLGLSLEEGQDYIDWERRKGLEEPALLYKQLFVAGTQWVAEGKIDDATLLWLQGKCYESLNEALCDTKRIWSAEIVLVVASFAHWTYLYDDLPGSPLCHVKAFRHLLDMHGGLNRIGLPRVGFMLLQLFDEQIEAKKAGIKPRGVRYTCTQIFRAAFPRMHN